MNLLRAASTVSAMTFLSRITGLARESLKAVLFGAGAQMDAFEAAFRLPNILRRMFAEGAFSQAFVPILAEYQRQRGADATRALVGCVGTLLAVVLLAVSILGILAAPWLVYLLAAGFERTPGKIDLTARMIRIVFPYILFISLVSLAGGVLIVHRRFAINRILIMVNKLEVTIDVIIHATEDISKFFKSFEDMFELKEENFSVNHTTGHFENPIITLNAKIEKNQAQKFVEKLVDVLSDDQIKELIVEREERTVDSRFHIRFDKQEFIKGNLMFKGKDAIKVKIHTPIYNKKDTVKIFSKIFQIAN